MLDFTKATDNWTIIDKGWKNQTAEERQIEKEWKFFKKIWNNKGSRLPAGQDLVAKFTKIFPSDPGCKTWFPLGEFKDLAGWTHKEIYDHWIARFYQRMEMANGKTSTMANVSGKYMIEKWKEEFGTDLPVENVSRAMSLMLFHAAVGMILEDRAHKELDEHYTNIPRFDYRPAEHKDENTGVDGFSFWAHNSDKTVNKFSIKCLESLTERYIMQTRTDEWRTLEDGTKKFYKGKTDPTIYCGYHTYDSKKLTFYRIDEQGKLVLMFAPPKS
jgi:hypothetical protein